VLAASYEARAFGARSGMLGRRARQLCPDLVFVGGHVAEYQRLGDAAIGILSDFTPSIRTHNARHRRARLQRMSGAVASPIVHDVARKTRP